MAKNKVNGAVPEPDWSFPMFWEDITFILKKIGEVIEAFIKSLKGE